jgi:hypothetical protein
MLQRTNFDLTPFSVAARFKASGYNRSLAVIAGEIHEGCVDVCIM